MTHDELGIPGYDKVDTLVQELIQLAGFSVLDAAARRNKDLYNQLKV